MLPHVAIQLQIYKYILSVFFIPPLSSWLSISKTLNPFLSPLCLFFASLGPNFILSAAFFIPFHFFLMLKSMLDYTCDSFSFSQQQSYSDHLICCLYTFACKVKTKLPEKQRKRERERERKQQSAPWKRILSLWFWHPILLPVIGRGNLCPLFNFQVTFFLYIFSFSSSYSIQIFARTKRKNNLAKIKEERRTKIPLSLSLSVLDALKVFLFLLNFFSFHSLRVTNKTTDQFRSTECIVFHSQNQWH